VGHGGVEQDPKPWAEEPRTKRDQYHVNRYTFEWGRRGRRDKQRLEGHGIHQMMPRVLASQNGPKKRLGRREWGEVPADQRKKRGPQGVGGGKKLGLALGLTSGPGPANRKAKETCWAGSLRRMGPAGKIRPLGGKSRFWEKHEERKNQLKKKLQGGNARLATRVCVHLGMGTPHPPKGTKQRKKKRLRKN